MASFTRDMPLRATSVLRHQSLDVVAQDADTLQVLTSLRYDEVGEFLRRLDKLLVHGFEHREVAVEHHIHGASALHHVALYVADEPFVAVGVNKDFQVHHLAQFAVDECHDAFDNDDGLGLHVYRLLQSVGEDIRVGGLFDGLAVAQLVDLLDEQFPVKGVGVVEIDLAPLFVGHPGGVVVIRVDGHHSHIVGRQGLDDFPYYSCFSGGYGRSR